MSDELLPSSVAEVPIVLAEIADRLAAGAITREDADDRLSSILGADELWAGFPPDHTESVQDSWTRLFDGREAERDRAAAVGDRQPRQNADPQPRHASPTPEFEDDLQRRALKALALAEKRHVEKTHDVSVRNLLETLMGDSSGTTVDKTKYDFVADSGGIDLPLDMHPDAAKTVVKAEYYSRNILMHSFWAAASRRPAPLPAAPSTFSDSTTASSGHRRTRARVDGQWKKLCTKTTRLNAHGTSTK
ncbi:hypothetical protein BDV93DRAFT_559404 [Ceratobasidium sp. AG-I]|nr:hypothetical protein BDV93DRAFT_559404 [Ceratobasidium sp. AG-I]